MENKKKKRFKLFDLQKEGKGISKNQAVLEPGLKRFFISYKNNFGKLITVNIIMVLCNFPIFFLIAALAGVSKSDVFYPLSDFFQNINGIMEADGYVTPYKMTLFAIEGLQKQDLAPTVITYIMYGVGALTIFTFGPVNAGTAYVLRNLVSGEPTFVWSDFKYALKRNIKQALPFGIIDIGITALLCWNIYSMIFSQGDFFTSLFFWCNVVIFLFYFFMRYYIYVQMVTFKLTVFKIFKNSLIFSLLGIKRNVMALFGILLGVVLEIFFLFGTGAILLPFAIAAPFTLLFSTFAYMKVYASYFKIKQIMIDPYMEQHPELAEESYDDEIIMRDDVTERERLEKIKNNIT